MCSLIYQPKFSLMSVTSYLAETTFFILGMSIQSCAMFSYMKVCINVSLISEVNFRVRKSYEVLQNFHRNAEVIR